MRGGDIPSSAIKSSSVRGRLWAEAVETYDSSNQRSRDKVLCLFGKQSSLCFSYVFRAGLVVNWLIEDSLEVIQLS